MKKNIHAIVKHLKQRYGTRNPEKIARYLGILICYKPYSCYTKGYYIKTLRNKFIVVNDALEECSKKIVLAHELGHAVLHSSEPVYFIREYTLFPVGLYEQEANKFAAELLIDDNDIKELYDAPTSYIAATLEVNEQLVQYKLNKRE